MVSFCASVSGLILKKIRDFFTDRLVLRQSQAHDHPVGFHDLFEAQARQVAEGIAGKSPSRSGPVPRATCVCLVKTAPKFTRCR
jgi:hypothetical protein